MVVGELIDVAAANQDARQAMKDDALKQARDICGASSIHAFLNAVEWYRERLEEIDRKGRCLACGQTLVAETVCPRSECGRDNS
jgi:hypothetical protein